MWFTGHHESMATALAHMTLADIARLAGVGRPAVSNWRRRYADFPQPVLETRSGPRFDPAEVEAWLAAHGKGKSGITPQERLWRAIEAQRGVLSVGRHLATATASLHGWGGRTCACCRSRPRSRGFTRRVT